MIFFLLFYDIHFYSILFILVLVYEDKYINLMI